MQKILIIKTGAAGDVVRTTSLLNILEGEITWVVDASYKYILPHNHPHLEIVALDTARSYLKGKIFDIVISLEENEICAKLAVNVPAAKLVGVYWQNGKISYTEDTSGWYDMSLISAKGKETADALKKKNIHSFQYWLFLMLGKSFTGQPYMINETEIKQKRQGLIGIEKRAGNTWPNKAWGGYEELISLLSKEEYCVKIFEQRKALRDYLSDIAGCSCIICGDTLAMHLALAYKIPCIAIFNCTSPAEIYDYGMLTKIISPLIEKNFYSREFSAEVINSVRVEEVLHSFKALDLPK